MKSALLLAVWICPLTLLPALSGSAIAQEQDPRRPLPSPAATLLPACGEEAVLSQGSLVTVQTGAEPGASDPMAIPPGRYSLLPIQGLGQFLPSDYYGLANAVRFFDTYDFRLNLGSSRVIQTEPWDTIQRPMVATAGRIVHTDHDDMVYAVRNGQLNDPNSAVNVRFVAETPVTTLPLRFLPQPAQSTDYLAIAQGDLDGVTGADGNQHNEVVVVHAVEAAQVSGKAGYQYGVDVLDYASGTFNPVITHTVFNAPAPDYNWSWTSTGFQGTLPSDNIVAVSVGDFDQDGQKEVAVATQGDGSVLLQTYRYSTVDGAHLLTLLGTKTIELNKIPGPDGTEQKYLVGTIALTAGDFDGDGKEELALGYAKWGNNRNQNPDYGVYMVGVLSLKYDINWNPGIADQSYVRWIGGIPDKSFTYRSRPHVELDSGQLLLSPPSIVYGRHQIALAWNDAGRPQGPQPGVSTTNITLRGLTLSNALRISEFAGGHIIPTQRNETNPVLAQQFSMAIGSFAGLETSLPLVQSLLVSDWDNFGDSADGIFWTRTLKASGAAPNQTWAQYHAFGYSKIGLPISARLPTVAYDRAGRSALLGAPVHMQIDGASRTDVVLQEPPKHLYWDERNHRVVNLTRSDSNNVHLFNEQSTSVETSTRDESTRAYGNSDSSSAGGTVSAGGSFLMFEASASASLEASQRSSYDYSENEAKYNSGYSSRKISTISRTDHDDFLSGELQTFDVWRYRVFGVPQENANSYYELVMPGPETPFSYGSMNAYWYQPVHENGNILSYPSRLGAGTNPYQPSDIGSYALPNGSILTEPLVPAHRSAFDGIEGQVRLDYSSAIAEAKSFSYSHAVAESQDIKASFTASFGVKRGPSVEVHGCGSTEFHNSSSWGGSKVSTDMARTETSVVLNRAAGPSAFAYPFYPVVYTTQDGTLKLSFAGPNPAAKGSNPAGYQTYADLYGGSADPALNLPGRFDSYTITPGQVGWKEVIQPRRKQMRGLFFRKPTVNSITGTYDFLSANPKAGDTVRIEPRIYNYSTGQGTGNIPVFFQAIEYDSVTNSEVCPNPINAAARRTSGLICPASARTTIGQKVIPTLQPLQWTCLAGTDDPAVTGCATPVYLDWNTSGYGGNGSGTREYRLYVVLNPNAAAGQEHYQNEAPPVAITNVEGTNPMTVIAPNHHLDEQDWVIIGGVQGLDNANGIFRVDSVTPDTFRLVPCESSLSAPTGCSTIAAPGSGRYLSGGMVTRLDPGQNNEGYGTIAVTTLGSLDTANSHAPQDYVNVNSLEAANELPAATLTAGNITAAVDQPLDLRFTAFSTAIHTDSAQVLLFDGNPAEGAPSVADVLIHPGANGASGTAVWFQWTPNTVGPHDLYAVLMEGPNSHEASQLTVNVVPVGGQP